MEQVVDALSRIARRPKSQITASMRLRDLGLGASAGMAALQAALERRLGLQIAMPRPEQTVAELAALAMGGLAASAPEKQDREPEAGRAAENGSALSSRGILTGMGTDLEEVQAMPETADLKGHEFYGAHFTEQELDVAVKHPAAREHLCGIFCAKEAVKKCSAELVGLRFSDIEILSAQNGQPTVRLASAQLASRFDFVVSISHTRNLAQAVVMAFQQA